MAFKLQIIESVQHFASTSRARSAVTLSAVGFAICHVIVLATSPASLSTSADLQAELPRLLLHYAAVFCRFALPLAFMLAGFSTGKRSRHTAP